MNIIANNCVGAMLYNVAGAQFNNPFMWSLVAPDDFIYLINNFNGIRLENVEPIDDNKLRVDSKIDVVFPHYKRGDNAEPVKIGSDVFCSRIREYTLDKWTARLKRMRELDEPPMFLISDRHNGTENGRYEFNDLSLVQTIDNPDCRILFIGVVDSPDLVPSPASAKDFTCIPVSSKSAAVGGIAKLIVKSGVVSADQDD